MWDQREIKKKKKRKEKAGCVLETAMQQKDEMSSSHQHSSMKTNLTFIPVGFVPFQCEAVFDFDTFGTNGSFLYLR